MEIPRSRATVFKASIRLSSSSAMSCRTRSLTGTSQNCLVCGLGGRTQNQRNLPQNRRALCQSVDHLRTSSPQKLLMELGHLARHSDGPVSEDRMDVAQGGQNPPGRFKHHGRDGRLLELFQNLSPSVWFRWKKTGELESVRRQAGNRQGRHKPPRRPEPAPPESRAESNVLPDGNQGPRARAFRRPRPARFAILLPCAAPTRLIFPFRYARGSSSFASQWQSDSAAFASARVSSQAIRSASCSTRSARSVMSSRFPIGVPTRNRVP